MAAAAAARPRRPDDAEPRGRRQVQRPRARTPSLPARRRRRRHRLPDLGRGGAAAASRSPPRDCRCHRPCALSPGRPALVACSSLPLQAQVAGGGGREMAGVAVDGEGGCLMG